MILREGLEDPRDGLKDTQSNLRKIGGNLRVWIYSWKHRV